MKYMKTFTYNTYLFLKKSLLLIHQMYVKAVLVKKNNHNNHKIDNAMYFKM